MNPNVMRKGRKFHGLVIISLVIIIFLFVIFVPIVPFTIRAPTSTIGYVQCQGSISYILTGLGLTYAGGRFWWGTPPVA
jgi:CBS domain containing-hemolysin-like protein